MKHWLFILFTVVLWCGTGAARVHAEALSIAALISDTSNPYWKAFEEGLRDSARDLGVVLKVYSLRSATDAEEQLNKCEAAILEKPKVILVAAVNGKGLASCLRKAQGAGTVLIDVDGNISEEDAKSIGLNIAFSVASNNYDLGKKAAEFVGNLEGEALVLEGLAGSQPSDLRVRGIRENLSQKIKIVGSQPADWDRVKASDIASRALLRSPELRVILAANDTMALGAVEAAKSANRNVTVVGIDGSSDAIAAIKQGRLQASVAQLPYFMASEAVNKAYRFVVKGEQFTFNQYIPVLTLSEQVLRDAKEPLLRHVK